MTDPIRLLLADDQQMVRAGFRLVLDAQPDMSVVGEARRLMTELRPYSSSTSWPPMLSLWISGCLSLMVWAPPRRS